LRLDLKENIVFPFSDPSWIAKTLIGSACYLMVLPMPAVVGYQLAIIRQTANGEDEKMPEFDGFGSMWVRGFIVSLLLGLLITVPFGIVAAMAVGGAVAFGEQSQGLAVMAMIGAVLLLLFGSFALAFLMPAMMLRYAMTEQIGSFFDFSTAIADIKQGFGDYLMIFFFPFVASLAVGMVGALTFGLGLVLSIPATVLIMYIQARMIGNYYRTYFM
jgi:hypothetical protein